MTEAEYQDKQRKIADLQQIMDSVDYDLFGIHLLKEFEFLTNEVRMHEIQIQMNQLAKLTADEIIKRLRSNSVKEG